MNGVNRQRGWGPTRARPLVEHLGGVAGIFRASLTELERAGTQAALGQPIFTGQSLEPRAAGDGRKSPNLKRMGVPLMIHGVLSPLSQIYDPPLVL
jgi:hypothetical protein